MVIAVKNGPKRPTYSQLFLIAEASPISFSTNLFHMTADIVNFLLRDLGLTPNSKAFTINLENIILLPNSK